MEELLNLKVDESTTIRDYLYNLLVKLWNEREGFSSKRPFGDSGWEYDLYIPLIKALAVKGSLDPDGFVEDVDELAADEVIYGLIEYVFYS